LSRDTGWQGREVLLHIALAPVLGVLNICFDGSEISIMWHEREGSFVAHRIRDDVGSVNVGFDSVMISIT
jgi:hypothetical protein